MKSPGSQRKTVLFSGHDLRFLRPFVAYCERSPKYRVLIDEHSGHDITNPDKCRAFLRCADIIFCEWCLGNAVWFARHKKSSQRLLIRLHLQEMRLPYLGQIQWDRVDGLVLICPQNWEEIRERHPFLRHKTHLIYNPIDCAMLNQPKLPGAEFNLGIMGISPMRKAPHLAFEILSQLKRIDRRYTLFVKGKHPRDHDWLWRQPAERAYYEKFFQAVDDSPVAESVVYETYGDDVPLWFSKIGFVLSTSAFEGSHQAVAEGMASGSIPIIRNWAGADRLYPSKYVFNTVEEAVGSVLKWRTSGSYCKEMEFCRGYAAKQFDQSRVCGQLEALIEAIARREPAHVRLEDRPPRASNIPPAMILGYIPAGSRGGYRIRIEQEIKALVKLGVRIQLACLHPDDADPAAMKVHRSELASLGCEVHLVPVNGFFDVGLDSIKMGAALDGLQRIAEASGVRIVHAEALYCARVGLLLRERCPHMRLVFDCHGSTPDEERLTGAHPSRISAMRDWECRALVSADLTVFVSEAMRDFFRGQYSLNGQSHAMVPCCVAEEQFTGKKGVRALAGIPANHPIIAYAGTMAGWQCGEEMMRLFAQLHGRDPAIHFLLLVPSGDHPRTRALMGKCRLSEDCVLLAEVPHDQVAAALQRAHACVLLRRAHPVNRVSSPTKFGEYLAAGVPVIMTDGIGDFSSMAAKRRVGLVLKPELLDVAEYPPRQIARILAFVRESMQRRVQVAARCRRVARSRLHWDAAAASLAKAYRLVLTGSRPTEEIL